MKKCDENWIRILENIFNAYVNQGTLEEGAYGMVFVSKQDAEIHQQFLDALTKGIDAAKNRYEIVVDIINRSGGYTANSTDDALELIEDLKNIYINYYGSK